MAQKRLGKEFQAITTDKAVPGITNIELRDDNLFVWTATLKPTEAPFNAGTYQIELEFPSDYPFKPPKVKFLTPIYHPNVDETGTKICLGVIGSDAWKPATKTHQVLAELVQIINVPETEHPLRADLAEAWVKDRKNFDKVGLIMIFFCVLFSL
eukprot:TRINITY_DN5802_c0_g1_i2.p1 TRINITY_DN5802_c0_g1~~TRINITY_DN5802_c0_g1_i2.p1  ORF type:complete len:154 (+),score=21.34 TRINITY_DN5802_c0_g1_i2:125-586(+)